jgi:HK97 gp10 family phage protein
MPAIKDTKSIKGLGVFTAQLASLARLDKVEVMTAGGEVLLTYMKSITPVDTGELRDSERLEVQKDNVVLIAEADHASYVEFGTIKMASQPFMRPTIDNQQKPALKAIGRNINDQIKELIRGTR